jgi:hypothetical protein
MNYPQNATEATTQIAALIAKAQELNKNDRYAGGYAQLSDAMLIAENFGLPLIVPTELHGIHAEIQEEWAGSASEWDSSGC